MIFVPLALLFGATAIVQEPPASRGATNYQIDEPLAVRGRSTVRSTPFSTS